jgi:hypothetical protein
MKKIFYYFLGHKRKRIIGDSWNNYICERCGKKFNDYWEI